MIGTGECISSGGDTSEAELGSSLHCPYPANTGEFVFRAGTRPIASSDNSQSTMLQKTCWRQEWTSLCFRDVIHVSRPAGTRCAVVTQSNLPQSSSHETISPRSSIVSRRHRHEPPGFDTDLPLVVWLSGRSQEECDRWFFSPATAVSRLQTMNYLWPLIAADQ